MGAVLSLALGATAQAGDADARGGKKPARAREAQQAVYRKPSAHGPLEITIVPAEPRADEVTRFLLRLDREKGDALELIAVVAPRSGDGPRWVYRVHPLDRGSTYGFNFTPPVPGLYQIELHPRGVEDRLDEPPDPVAEVQLGVGVPSPMLTLAEQERVSAYFAKDGQNRSLTNVMELLSDQWETLRSMLLKRRGTPEDWALRAKVVVQLSRELPGKSPSRRHAAEFDQLAKALGRQMEQLPGAVRRPATALGMMTDLENTVCLRCHTKFRFELTDDVSRWPAFKPDESKPRSRERSR